jgi:hypothetical protein
MVSYKPTIDTANSGDLDETETDRMWRQIDPVLAHAMKRAIA